MICCDSCDDWFHGKCVGVSQEQADNLKSSRLMVDAKVISVPCVEAALPRKRELAERSASTPSAPHFHALVLSTVPTIVDFRLRGRHFPNVQSKPPRDLLGIGKKDQPRQGAFAEVLKVRRSD